MIDKEFFERIKDFGKPNFRYIFDWQKVSKLIEDVGLDKAVETAKREIENMDAAIDRGEFSDLDFQDKYK